MLITNFVEKERESQAFLNVDSKIFFFGFGFIKKNFQKFLSVHLKAE